MNKTNKYLNIALRCMIFVSFVMMIVLWGAFFKAFGKAFVDSGVKIAGLSTEEQSRVIVEQFLGSLNEFTGAFTLYYVELVFLCITALLSLLTRYKAKIVSFIFRTLTLLLTVLVFFGGAEVPMAISKLGNYSGLSITAHDKESLISSLTANGVSAADVDSIAATLSDKEQIGGTLVAYVFVPMLLFILVITSIHCLVKRSGVPAQTEE